MKHLRILPAFALIALSASLLVAATQELAARSGETITFDLRSGGDIDVSGWDRESAEVTSEVTGRDAAKLTVHTERVGSGIRVSTPSAHGRVNATVRVQARVPRNYNVEIKTMGGDVRLQDLRGNFNGETMGGDIILSKLQGETNISTMGGDISVRGSTLNGEVSTMGGDVEMDDVAGNLNASTMGGDVIQRNVRRTSGPSGEAVKIRSHGGDVKVDTAPAGADVHTMGGDIQVRSADEFLKAKTMGGDIHIARATGDADIHTMGGDITVLSFDGGIRAVTMGGDVSVHVDAASVGAEHGITLDSMGGDLTLSLPKNFSGRFEIELIKLRKREDDAEIVSDIALDIHEPAEWTPRSSHTDGRKYGSDYKVITASGSVGGGDHLVRLSTISGVVRIVQR